MARKIREPTSISAWARCIAAVLEDSGCDAEAAFREAGLDWSLVHKPYARYPVRGMQRLWRVAVRMTGDPAIAFKVVEYMAPTNLHDLSVAVLASGTLGHAMEIIARYAHFSTEMWDIAVNRRGGAVQIRVVAGDHGIVPEPEVVDVAMAILAKTWRVLGTAADGADGVPLRVELMRPRPRDPGPWEEYFQAPLVFDAPRNSLHYDRRGFDAPLPGVNRRLVSLSEQFVANYLASLEKHSPFAAQVSGLIVQQLASGRPSLARVAGDLGVSPSTLGRRLRREELTFNALLDDCRRTLAGNYLKNTKLTLSEVTFMLGFSDQGNFTRSFKRWYGCTPSKYRTAGSRRGPASELRPPQP